jgi:hypothetical protein
MKKLFENYQQYIYLNNLNEFAIHLPFINSKKANRKRSEKYFNKTLKRANKGKATSGDVDRARRAMESFKEK